MSNLSRKYFFPATLGYIVLVVVVNIIFSYTPLMTIFGCQVSPMDAFVGVIYLARDFAQREIKHYVLLAMLVGLIFSYELADKAVAFASAAAFFSGELVDWLIFTFTRKPLSQRLLWSAAVSTPVDSTVFLLALHQLNWLGFLLMSAGKWLGVLLVWYIWKKRQMHQKSSLIEVV